MSSKYFKNIIKEQWSRVNQKEEEHIDQNERVGIGPDDYEILDALYYLEETVIQSIRRLSDGEIFSIGDGVEDVRYQRIGKIKGFHDDLNDHGENFTDMEIKVSNWYSKTAKETIGSSCYMSLRDVKKYRDENVKTVKI